MALPRRDVGLSVGSNGSVVPEVLGTGAGRWPAHRARGNRGVVEDAVTLMPTRSGLRAGRHLRPSAMRQRIRARVEELELRASRLSGQRVADPSGRDVGGGRR